MQGRRRYLPLHRTGKENVAKATQPSRGRARTASQACAGLRVQGLSLWKDTLDGVILGSQSWGGGDLGRLKTHHKQGISSVSQCPFLPGGLAYEITSTFWEYT